MKDLLQISSTSSLCAIQRVSLHRHQVCSYSPGNNISHVIFRHAYESLLYQLLRTYVEPLCTYRH
jgi:hypothetical protein